MAHTETLRAIVLQTYDVGEADRFCILLTRERGKVAARARGVRKMQSRMGGSLLQGTEVLVDIHEGKAGALITGVKTTQEDMSREFPLSSFVSIQEGIELLLAVVHDEEPIPEIYDATIAFLNGCSAKPAESVLRFMVTLSECMGLLPEEEHALFARLTEKERHYLRVCKGMGELPDMEQTSRNHLMSIVSTLFRDHTNRLLKVSVVGDAILTRQAPVLAAQEY